MNVLALDTSTGTAAVALATEEECLAEFHVSSMRNHSENIMPMVETALKIGGMGIDDVDYIAVTTGPGSFTGLRMGAATAKALAHGIGKKLVPVPTLDALAYNVFENNRIIVPVIPMFANSKKLMAARGQDARQDQVYAGFYEWREGKLVRLLDYMADHFYKVEERAYAYNRPFVFLGNDPAHPACNMRGSSIARAAFNLIRAGKWIQYDQLELMYIQKPQAEREKEQEIKING